MCSRHTLGGQCVFSKLHGYECITLHTHLHACMHASVNGQMGNTIFYNIIREINRQWGRQRVWRNAGHRKNLIPVGRTTY